MDRNRKTSVAFAIAAMCVVSPGVSGAQTASATRRAIDAANKRYVAAFNAGDVAKSVQVYATDATLMPSNSPAIHGPEAIAKFWQGGWAMGIRNVKLTTTELDVHGNSAAEVGQYEFDIQPANNGPAGHDRGKYIVLWKRNKGGEWQWYRDIFNSDVPAAPAAAR